MKKLNALIPTFLFLLIAGSVFGAKSPADTSFYRSEAKLIPFNREELLSCNAYILEDNRMIDYGMNKLLVTRHKIIHIENKEGLDDNNKISIYLPNESGLVALKARSISKSGEVREFDQSNLKEIKDVKDGADLKVFAIEGAEVEGQIEFLYTISMPLYDAGKESYSVDYPTRHGCFIMHTYSKFISDVQLYNHEILTEKFENGQIYTLNSIPPIVDEKYATPRANRVYVEYKLCGTSTFKGVYASYESLYNSKKAELFNFSSAEKSKAGKVVKKFLKDDRFATKDARNMVGFLREKFFYVDKYQTEYSSLLNTLKSGYGNDLGLTKLYASILENMGIEYEILITCNKYDARLDEKFCSRYTTGEYLIYLPKTFNYIYPASQTAHFDFVPSWIIGNKALVCPRIGSYKFREVTSHDPEVNKTRFNGTIRIDLEKNNTLFDLYSAGTGQIAYTYNSDIYSCESDAERRKELESYVNWRYPDAEILDLTFLSPEKWGNINACEDYECIREYTAKVRSTSFFDRAGDQLLLNVGTLLGPQTELYSALSRVQPISNAYNKSYSFKFIIPIPDGYKYGGEQKVVIDNLFKNQSGENIAGFQSKIKIENNEIIIEVEEFYGQVNLDKENYEDFRRIINSAADFNQSIVLLEKI